MKLSRFIYFSLILLVSGVFSEGGSVEVRVTGRNVNLRARPDMDSERVGQVTEGDILLARGALEGEWIQIVAPDSVDLWVYSELIKDGRVAASSVNVRSGPGISFRPVGQLPSGTEVEQREKQGNWQKIAPPKSCSLWISSRYVERIEPAKPEKKKSKDNQQHSESSGRVVNKFVNEYEKVRMPPVPEGAMRIYPESSEDGSAATGDSQGIRNRSSVEVLPYELRNRELVDSVSQGDIVEYAGFLRPTGFAWHSPSEYRLACRDMMGRALTICYVIGERTLLKAREDYSVIVHGRQYWLKNTKYPLVVVDQLIVRD